VLLDMSMEKKSGRLLFYVFITCFIISNPLFYSIAINHVFNYTPTEFEAGMLGLYAIGWVFIGIIFILIPIFFKKKEEVKVRTIDEIISDLWKEHKLEVDNGKRSKDNGEERTGR